MHQRQTHPQFRYLAHKAAGADQLAIRKMEDAYLSSLQRQAASVELSPDKIKEMEGLSRGLTSLTQKLKEHALNLSMANQCAEVRNDVERITEKLKGGESVIGVAVPVTKTVQKLAAISPGQEPLDLNADKLRDLSTPLVSVLLLQDSDKALTALEQVKTSINKLCVAAIAPILSAANEAEKLVSPWTGRPELQVAKAGLQKVVSSVTDFRIAQTSENYESLLAAVAQAQGDVAKATRTRAQNPIESELMTKEQLENHIQEVTGRKPSFEGWLTKVRSLGNYARAKARQEPQRKNAFFPHVSEDLDQMVSGHERNLMKSSSEELAGLAGYLLRGAGRDALTSMKPAERAAIEKLVGDRCSISPEEMELINTVSELVSQNSRKYDLLRQQATLQRDLSRITELTKMKNIRLDRKTELVELRQKYVKLSQALLTTVIDDSIQDKGYILTKNLVLGPAEHEIRNRLARVEKHLEELSKETESTKKAATKKAREHGISEGSTPLGKKVQRLFDAGYWEWKPNELNRWNQFFSQVASARLEVTTQAAPLPTERTRPASQDVVRPGGNPGTVAPTGRVVITGAQQNVPVPKLPPVIELDTDPVEETGFFWDLFSEDAGRFGLEIDGRLDKTGDPLKADEVIRFVADQVATSLESEAKFGGEDQGVLLVRSILQDNLKALIQGDMEDIRAWTTEVCNLISHLRLAEGVTEDKRIAEALSGPERTATINAIVAHVAIPEGASLKDASARLESHNKTTSGVVAKVWDELKRNSDAAGQMELLTNLLGFNLHSRLLPKNISALKAELESDAGLEDPEDSLEGDSQMTDLQRQDLHGLIRGKAESYANHRNTPEYAIPEFMEKGLDFYTSFAFAIAYGWGTNVRQSRIGINIGTFRTNLRDKGTRALTDDQIDDVLKFGKEIGLLQIGYHKGNESIHLHTDGVTPELVRFIHQIQELRRPGGQSGTSAAAPVRPPSGSPKVRT